MKKTKIVIVIIMSIILAGISSVIIACGSPCSKSDAHCSCIICFCGYDFTCRLEQPCNCIQGCPSSKQKFCGTPGTCDDNNGAGCGCPRN